MGSYLGNDVLGSSEVALDGSGNVQASRLYTPYGGVRYRQGTMPTDYGFTGQRNDTTTGLQYYGSRFYDPQAGQFVSADTVLPGGGYDPLGLSRYAYVGGNPVLRTDPSGHAWWSGIWNTVQHWASHTWNTVRSRVSGAVSWVTGFVSSWHPSVAAAVSQFHAAVRRFFARAPVRRSARMSAHPQRRQIHKMAVVPRPSGKIRDPMPPRPSGKIKDPIPDPKPRPNIMAIAGFEFGPQITTLGDIPGLSNILNNSDKGKGTEQPPRLIYEPNPKHGPVTRPGSRGPISRQPRGDCQAMLECSEPVSPTERRGVEPDTGEQVIFRRHREFEGTEWWHGYVP
jgi:RHS repeat-associated protein